MTVDEMNAILADTVDTLIMPGAYLAGIKSVREVMKDDGFRRLYGHILLHELMPRLDVPKELLEEGALIFSQKTELSRDAVITRLANAVTRLRDSVLGYLSKETPCMLLGCAAAMMLYAGPHDAFEEAPAALENFRGLSPDMPADTLIYAVFGDRDFWRENILENDDLCDALAAKIGDLQILGVRGAMEKTFREKYTAI